MKRTGPANKHLRNLIQELIRLSADQDVKIWKAIAKNLNRPTRQRTIINLFKINKLAKENETVIIPGKVLGNGELNRKITISAFYFSKSAKEKIKQCGCKAITINELIKTNPKGSKVRIIG
tara:strand:- start:1197 stop:1559 length:363 start_codon:yes stop_codon:yes gene_type:complete